jgi:uncharacterized repeat protein (TIGR03803 family)
MRMLTLKPLLALTTIMLGFVFVIPSGRAQTYTVLYNFTGGSDGASPQGTLIIDSGANLYGTTRYGGDLTCLGEGAGCGVVFKLDPFGTETVLHTFEDLNDGQYPAAGLTLGAGGSLFGTTLSGGTGNGGGDGTVFKLDPSGHETVLFAFNANTDFVGGASPVGNVVLDPAGNIYGATAGGGNDGKCQPSGCGVIYKLNPVGGEDVLHIFTGEGNDGSQPGAGPVRDSLGRLYFTTTHSALIGPGAAFRLTPHGELSVLEFPSGAGKPSRPVGPTFDVAGNAYIPMLAGGSGNAGGIDKVSPTGKLVGFASCDGTNCSGPNTGMVFDAAGNLYGTSQVSAGGAGNVFKLDTAGHLTAIHNFSSQDGGGYYPLAGLVKDSAGNLYGTTSKGGAFNYGVVFKITP